MKTSSFYSFLFLFLFPAYLFAEKTLSNGFIFPDFKQGVVTLKNGSNLAGELNYYYVNQKMLFRDNGKINEFAEPASVVAVTIDGRLFINVGNGTFYEQVPAGDGFYYIQWFAKVIGGGKGVAYGGYSGLSSVKTMGSFNDGGGNYGNLKLNEKYETEIKCNYYLNIKNKYKRIDSANALDKLFKGHEAEIESFVKEQNIDFEKSSDIAKVAEFCNKFLK